MRIAFFSNYINHHQIPLSEAFLKRIGSDYLFVATENIPDERIKMGYPNDNKKYSYVMTTYETKEDEKKAQKVAFESDVVILGSASDRYITKRLKKNKISFRYCERYYRKGWNVKTIPQYFLSGIYHHRRFQNRPLYYLCSSAYTAGDVNIFANYHGRQYKWGYFPEVIEYNIDELIKKKRQNKKTVILWVARLLKLKHPEAAVYVAERLKEDGIDFELNIIGSGEREKCLRDLISEKGLEKNVNMLGAKTPKEVRTFMENSNIFLFTSDYNEGWGAVVNESMNSACAVVVSHAVGSAPFLIKNGKNGFIYKNGNIDDLYIKVKKLVDDEKLRELVGENAYFTMIKQWNADVAAERLIVLCEMLLKGKDTPYDEGPCSKAESIKEKDMFNYLMREE